MDAMDAVESGPDVLERAVEALIAERDTLVHQGSRPRAAVESDEILSGGDGTLRAVRRRAERAEKERDAERERAAWLTQQNDRLQIDLVDARNRPKLVEDELAEIKADRQLAVDVAAAHMRLKDEALRERDAARAMLVERQQRICALETALRDAEAREQAARLAREAHRSGEAMLRDHAVITQKEKAHQLAIALERANDEVREQQRKLAMVATHIDNVWRWQGAGVDEGNEPSTLSCPVVMSADTLRELTDKMELQQKQLEAAREALMFVNAFGAPTPKWLDPQCKWTTRQRLLDRIETKLTARREIELNAYQCDVWDEAIKVMKEVVATVRAEEAP
jgi:chromosome segregation ATPase